MKAVLAACASRGDVQPFVCLGRALVDHGHDVKLLVPRNGETMARAAGLSLRTLPFDYQAMLRAEPAQRMLAAGNLSAFMRWLHEEETKYAAELRQALIEGTESAGLIVCGIMLTGRCHAIAAARGIAALQLCLVPNITSGSYVNVYLPQRSLGAPLNRLSHRLASRMYWRTQREELTTLHRELEAWLDAGPPPVFLGFGSMPVLDEGAMLRSIREALARLGVRGILAAGWSELDAAGDETLYVVDEVDHQSLFPRCVAAVHHGGSGTTAAGAAAGVPTLVCSTHADQPFWGARCRKLGIGETLPFTKLDTRRLVEGLRNVLRPEVAARTKEIARRMAEEDGVANAVARIEDMEAAAFAGDRLGNGTSGSVSGSISDANRTSM